MSTATPAPPPSQQPDRRRLGASDLALVASFAALIAVLGAAPPVYAFGNAVPITLQSLGVMLAGAVLGARRGALAVLTLLTLCLVGLPVLSGGRGGVGVFAAPTAGYLVGWVLGAAAVGALVHGRGRVSGGLDVLPSPTRIALAAIVGGIGVVYLCGIPVAAWRTGVDLLPAAVASVVYLPGDLLKAGVTAVVAAAVLRANPRLLAR